MLTNFFKKNISLLIYSQLPLITIEQLKLRKFSNHSKQFINQNGTNEILESKEYQTINFYYEKNLNNEESSEFHCNDYANNYKYYESFNEGNSSSVNLL